MECSRCNNFLDLGDGEGEQGKGEKKSKEMCVRTVEIWVCKTL